MNYSLPDDFINRMKEYLGEEYDQFIDSYNSPEVKGIRFNIIAPDLSGAICNVFDGNEENTLQACFQKWSKIPWVNYGFCYELEDDLSFRPGKHPYHEAGAYYIQEPSAMAPAVYLSPVPGDRVLDLCAAPGGKTTQLGAMLQGRGILIANEIMPDRAKILSENIERMGIRNALVISEDPRNISDKFEGYFDKILVDAPCSGEGMFRRSETAVKEWSLDNVKLCADRQSWILDEASKMLAPGGKLVYSTCTFSKEEDENTIKGFLDRHDDFELDEMYLYKGMERGYDNVGIRLWPHKVKGEGHFVCVLCKKKNVDSYESKIMPPCGYQLDLSKKEKAELKDMFDFIKENITDDELIYENIKDRRFVKFKDQIYMIPHECPSLRGIKVLRPGLHMGTILKNRFEPAHALAKSLFEGGVRNTCILKSNDAFAKVLNGLSSSDIEIEQNDRNIYKYINGETFNYEGKNGWYLIFVDKYPIGWGKFAGGIMKNHYPKGLRKNI